ncbi:hypothetical protein CRG98_024569 [Punica granatum]|uniref:Uncharacterized protein n=1 Tax=Punica granatum TaxID=22663 RepID=A0A2I0JGE2_PUNGR|nr:hypothetical protein CRG98_024569 [Punica granatum]
MDPKTSLGIAQSAVWCGSLGIGPGLHWWSIPGQSSVYREHDLSREVDMSPSAGSILWDSRLRLLEGIDLPKTGLAVRAVACFGSPGNPWRVFALAMQMGSRFRRPRCEASRGPVGHAWAYRDILNDALAALSVIQHTCRLRTLRVRVP